MKVLKEIVIHGLILLGAFCNMFYLMVLAVLPLSAGCGGAPDTWVWWAIYLPAPFIIAAQPRLFKFIDKWTDVKEK